MKPFKFLVLFFVLIIHSAYSQDTIIKISPNEPIFCKITKVTSMTIFYTENKIGKSIPKKEVSYFSNHEPAKKETPETSEKIEKIAYTVILSNDFFTNDKYNFSVVKVIDGRLNSKRAIGSIVGMSIKPQFVGNDSLAQSMDSYFKSNKKLFDTTTKIIMVLNQLNLQYIGGYSMSTGKIQDLEMAISLDYYKLNRNKCALIYQQYFKHKEDVKYILRPSKAINFTFFETVRLALLEFNSQLKINKLLGAPLLLTDSLPNLVSKKQSQKVTNQNIKDGLFFSCKDIYLNNPGLLTDYTLNFQDKDGKPSFTIKANNYIINYPNAIVTSKRIFIHSENNIYKEVELGKDGRLYLDGSENDRMSKIIDYETGNSQTKKIVE